MTEFTEDELLLIYEDLLAVPPPVQEMAKNPVMEDNTAILNNIAERIIPSQNSPLRGQHYFLHSSDWSFGASGSLANSVDDVMRAPGSVSYKDILARLRDFIGNLKTGLSSTGLNTQAGHDQLPITPGILTEKEWTALAQVCVC